MSPTGDDALHVAFRPALDTPHGASPATLVASWPLFILGA